MSYIFGDPLLNLCPVQITLFKDWVAAWSDDQKSYLILRLKVTNGSETRSKPPLQDIDQAFCKKYEVLDEAARRLLATEAF